MCDPVTATLVTVSMAGAALGAAATHSSLKAQEKDHKRAAAIERLRGSHREAELMRDRNRRASQNLAVMASSGLDLSSGSFEAIKRANNETLRRDMDTNAFNTRMRTEESLAKARQAGVAAGIAVATGILDTATAGINAYGAAGGSFGGAPTTKTAGASITGSGSKL